MNIIKIATGPAIFGYG